MTTRSTRLAGVALVAGLGIATLAACGGGGSSVVAVTLGGGGGGGGGKKIALLLPESKTTRYETFDRPLFEAAVKSRLRRLHDHLQQRRPGPRQAAAAGRGRADPGRQRPRARPGRRQGCRRGRRQRQGPGRPGRRLRPVHRRGRLLRLLRQRDGRQARRRRPWSTSLKKGGKTSGDVVMINGSPTDPNAANFKKGAHSVLDTSGYKVAAEYDTPDWSPDKAQAWMEGQISAVKGNLVGVYAANDGTAGGAIAALKGGGVNSAPARDRPGRRARRDPAHPRGRPGHDHLQADQARGRRPRPRPRSPWPTSRSRRRQRTSRASRPRSSSRSRSSRPTSRTPSSRTASTRSDQICAGSFAKACSAAGLS